MTDKDEELLPCPFCGEQPELWDGLGTQADLTCNECGHASVGMQVTDCLTQEEKYGNDGNAQPGFAWIDTPHYRYEDKAVERVNSEMIEAWNTRTPQPSEGDVERVARAIYGTDRSNVDYAWVECRQSAERAIAAITPRGGEGKTLMLQEGEKAYVPARTPSPVEESEAEEAVQIIRLEMTNPGVRDKQRYLNVYRALKAKGVV